jgi:polar amino acid transport system substrate-binding protein
MPFVAWPSSLSRRRWLALATLLLIGGAEAAEPATLTLACVVNAQPYCYSDQGAPAGMVVKLMDEVARSLGIRVEILQLPWARAQAMVREGEIDMLVTVPTEERFRYAYFGREAVIVEPFKLFIRRGQPELAARLRAMTRLEDLRGLQLVTYVGDGFAAQYLSQGYELQRVSQADRIPSMLLHDRAQVALTNATLFRQWVRNSGLVDEFDEIDIDWPHTHMRRVPMLSRKSPWHERGLLKAIDAQIRQMKRDGRWQALVREYLGPYGMANLVDGPPDLSDELSRSYYAQYDAYPAWQAARGKAR